MYYNISEITNHSPLNSSSNEEAVERNVDRKRISESIEKEAFARPEFANRETVAELRSVPDSIERRASPRCEYIKSGSVNEIMYEDENVFFEEKDDLGVKIEPLTAVAVDTGDASARRVENFDPQDEEKLTELIDLLIEEENAKLVASGTLGYDSDTDDSGDDEVVDLTATKCETIDLDDGNELEEVAKHDSLPKQNTYDMIEENCVISERRSDRLSVSPVSVQYEHFHSESSDKSPQRKVAFRLNSADDDLVYPGQTDSEECTSSSDNSEEPVENNAEEKFVEEPPPFVVETVTRPEAIAVPNSKHSTVEEPPCVVETVARVEPIVAQNFKPSTDIERKFERMASESLEEDEECGQVVEGEFHRIVSQLSHEEVDDCLNAWNETTVAINDDKSTKTKGTDT